MRRILVTGSRDWPDNKPMLIGVALDGFARHQGLGKSWAMPFTVVVGYDPQRKRPHGVDEITYGWCVESGYDVEPHPADWDTHGKAAGFIRNQEMVDSGADLCLAFFWKKRTPGTADCLRRAEAAGIPVYEVHKR